MSESEIAEKLRLDIAAIIDMHLRPTGPFGISPQTKADIMEKVLELARVRSQDYAMLQQQVEAYSEHTEEREDVIADCIGRLKEILPRLHDAAEAVAIFDEEEARETFLWKIEGRHGITVADLRLILNSVAQLSDT